MRVAWFTPLPPHRSGIAAYSADVLPALAAHHTIDAYVDDSGGPAAGRETVTLPGITVRGAFDFAWRMAQQPYDLVVYQLGNDSCHDYMWAYLVQYPGLVVLHDGQLHQARARALLRLGREDDYVREFVYNYPFVGESVPRMVAVGLGTAFYYLWPMLRIPLEAARLTAVHNPWLRGQLAAQYGDVPLTRIRMGVPDPLPQVTESATDIRRRHGVPETALLLAAYGRVTPEKGLTGVLMALSQLGPAAAHAHLLCVGETVPYYDLAGEARQLGLGDRLHVTGYVADERLPAYLAAADACVCLRWPTSRETSASWLRCLAAGKPTIVHDLLHTGDVPTLDPRTMRVRSTGGNESDPAAVGVDLHDESNTLRLSIAALVERPDLRARVGRAARRVWEADATIGLAVGDCLDAMDQARTARPLAPRAAWPRHLRLDGTQKTWALLHAAGLAPASIRAIEEALGPARPAGDAAAEDGR